MPPPPAPLTVDLFTDVDFPEHMAPGSEAPLVVKLTPVAPQSTRIDSSVPVDFADPHTPEKVDVIIHAPAFNERTDKWRQTIDVYSFTESTPAIFFLTASTVEGTYTVNVDFRHKGRLVGSFKLETNVTSAPAPAMPLSKLTPAADSDTLPIALAISADPPPPADVELRVHLSGNTLHYELHCPTANLDSANMGEVQLKTANPQSYLAGLFAELSSLAQGSANEAGALAQLEASGENLYLDLFPAALQAADRQLVELRQAGKLASFLIVSDEPWIPWELAKPYDADNDHSDDFLAGGWQLCRWLSTSGPADRVQIVAARLVAPALDLDFVEQEIASFAEIARWGVDIGPAPLQKLQEVQSVSEQGGIELLHFATHGNFTGTDPDKSAIRLAEQSELYPRDLRGSRVRGLRKARPIVFLNACHTAQIGFAFTGLGGWAERMIVDVRASAFIGTLWEVNDKLAAAVSAEFYRALWTGDTLGQAFHAARQHVRALQPGNSTWLAYTLYADPNVRVHWGN